MLRNRFSGLFAIKDYRDSINQDDFNKAVRKVAESKKLEGKLEYQKLLQIRRGRKEGRFLRLMVRLGSIVHSHNFTLSR